MSPYDVFIFDLDGTIYLGDQLIAGAKETITLLRQSGKRVVFLSNKPIAGRRDYAEKLTRLGITTQTEDVVNSSFVAAQFFSKETPGAHIYVIGEQVLVDELTQAGLQMAQTVASTDIVLISLDREVNYEKIHFAYHAAKAGAKIWATNPDLVCPMPDDEIIDAGATIAAIEALLRRPIDGVIGKPSAIMIKAIVDMVGAGPERCVMIGDRIETDVLMGNEAGMTSVLVMSGVTDHARLEAVDIVPGYVLDSVADIPRTFLGT